MKFKDIKRGKFFETEGSYWIKVMDTHGVCLEANDSKDDDGVADSEGGLAGFNLDIKVTPIVFGCVHELVAK